MQVSLKILSGKLAGKEIPIPGPHFVIGRSEGCQLRAQSELISRRHCALVVDAFSARVMDLGSRNGTFVNDERVEGERPLVSGDRLTIGQLRFQVDVKSSLGGQKKPKVVDVKDAAQRTVDHIPESDDSEVASWLKEATSKQATGDDLSISETLASPPVTPDTDSPAGKETVVRRRDQDETLVQGGGRGGRPRPLGPPPTQTKDSQEAAAEILRQLRLRNRR